MVKLSDLPMQFRKKTVKQRLERVCRENDVVFLAMFGSFVRGGADEEEQCGSFGEIRPFERKKLAGSYRC